MIDCLLLGDSIAVGLYQQLPQCESLSKGGWNTAQWNRDYLKYDLSAGTVIISLGTNDHKYIKTQAELERLRDKIQASRVFWVLPKNNLPAGGLPIEEVQRIIKVIAALHGDIVIPITRVQSDGIHPSWAGYKQIASSIKP
jgi:lysophospholipase L1-like esterase